MLGELTARQRRIVTLAAAGLSNRQIAEPLSVRTLGSRLHSAWTPDAPPWPAEPPQE